MQPNNPSSRPRPGSSKVKSQPSSTSLPKFGAYPSATHDFGRKLCRHVPLTPWPTACSLKPRFSISSASSRTSILISASGSLGTCRSVWHVGWAKPTHSKWKGPVRNQGPTCTYLSYKYIHMHIYTDRYISIYIYINILSVCIYIYICMCMQVCVLRFSVWRVQKH